MKTMNQHLPSPVKFREDINGLRAWAVIAVLLFHYSLIGLPGGFAGVDVFFVISGYLMTTIIVGGYEKRNFSIWKFYMARARRIIPALLVVIAVLLVLGWFYLPTSDYQSLGSQSTYALSFLSNIHYWRSSGYFDTAAHEKWLLHTWSLSVEAQFYVLYPIFIAIIWRFWQGLKALTISLTLLFIICLAINLYYSQWKPDAAFYLLPTRGWELVAGGLVYLLTKQGFVSESIKHYAFWPGWALMVGSFAFINNSLVWPGYWAVAPVLGTSLIILVQRERCILTGNALAQWLGDRSYSLYLWHWPFMVALYFTNLQASWFWVSVSLIISILLSHLSYRFVEVPTRQYLTRANLVKEIIAIGSVGIIIGLVAVAAEKINFEERVPQAVEIAANESLNRDPRRVQCQPSANGKNSPKCMYGGQKIGAVVFGDSHAQATITAIGQAAENHGKGALFLGTHSCPAILDLKYDGTDIRVKHNLKMCANNLIEGMGYLKGIPDDIPLVNVSRTSVYMVGPNEPDRIALKEDVLSSKYFEHNLAQIAKSACEFQQQRQVYLMRPIPEISIDIPKTLSRNLMLGRSNDNIKITLAEYHERNKLVWEAQDEAAKQCGVKILDPLPYLCDDQYCYGSRNGRPIYFDDDHLSEYGNKLLVPMFEKAFKQQ